MVNGHKLMLLRDGFAKWQILLTPTSASGIVELLAQATDAAGNIEPRPHRVVLVAATNRGQPRSRNDDKLSGPESRGVISSI